VQNNHSKFPQIVETTNKVLQIVALLAAGSWALWTWSQATAPSLKTGLTVFGDFGSFSWDASSNACKGYITVTIENIGQRNIVVSRVKYDVFEAKATRLESSRTVKVVETPESTESVKTGTLELLAGAYAPKVKDSWEFPVFMSADMKGELWFKVEAFDRANKSLEFWYGQIPSCR
jgi:hypothetical protein